MSDHALVMFWDLQNKKLRSVGTLLLLAAMIGLLVGVPEPASEFIPYQATMMLLAWDAWVLTKVAGGRTLLELGIHDVDKAGFLHRFVAARSLRLGCIVWPFALLLAYAGADVKALSTALMPFGYAAGLYWLFTAYRATWARKVGLLFLAIVIGSVGATVGHMADAAPAARQVCAHLFALAVYAC